MNLLLETAPINTLPTNTSLKRINQTINLLSSTVFLNSTQYPLIYAKGQ